MKLTFLKKYLCRLSFLLFDKRIRKEIVTAIKDFEEAIKEVEELGNIYNRIKDLPLDTAREYGEEIRSKETKTISPIVQKANESLRGAANRLSIAFKQSDNLLFLGDLEAKEIGQVVKQLKKASNLTHF